MPANCHNCFSAQPACRYVTSYYTKLKKLLLHKLQRTASMEEFYLTSLLVPTKKKKEIFKV